MKIAIIGAGISGLSAGRLLKRNGVEVDLYERKNDHGGIARVKMVGEIPYHLVGGHCFNSKNEEVLDFVFENILPKDNWHYVKRNAAIYFKDNIVNYPIEFAVKQIFDFNKQLALDIVKDFFSSNLKGNEKNLAEWFVGMFGETLAREYFIPYNTKIWNRSPFDMSHEWVKDKLPIPNKIEFLRALVSEANDTMSHAYFYYPKEGTQNRFIDALSEGLNIYYNFDVKELKLNDTSISINNKNYDYVINTSPLDHIKNLFPNNIKLKEMSSYLKFNRVTTMLWETKSIDRTWTYLPDTTSICHRHIHIGNFLEEKKNYTITEATGIKTYEEMKLDGEKYNYLIKPIDYNISEQAYVVFDEMYNKVVPQIKNELEKQRVYSLGRFGEWEYYNMDICIEKAMELVNKILNR